ncbi:centrosomal protein kizuna isoform X3 [Oryzias latipes]|uniref:centrosomal protein kizuna isoform X3 n=2 Tax=Oryzias latipes TaxID=8090 RepID=UPI000CE21B16|nr:centrosomal protein kizuna isoform X3 [Oryzias latipes]
MAGLSCSEDQYYKKVTEIQQEIYEREKRRLQLERELFVYSRSDKRISQINSSKLRSYLKEITDREVGAKMRNLELQRAAESIEISMREYHPECGSLQQQKADFLKKISKYKKGKQKPAPRHEASKGMFLSPGVQNEGVHIQHPKSHISHPGRHFPQSTVETFTDHQISRDSDSETADTSVRSHKAFLRSPNRSVHSHGRTPSGLLKDFRVGGKDGASKQTHLSDDISGSNGSLDGCNWSNKHERTVGLLPSVRALTGAAGSIASGSDDQQEASPFVTLKGSEKNPSPSNDTPMRPKHPPAESRDSQEAVHEPLIMGDEQRGLGHLMSETTLEKEAQERSGTHESLSASSSDVQLSESSASDLTLSLTQSELEDDVPDEAELERESLFEGRDHHKEHCLQTSLNSNGSNNTSQLDNESTGPAVTSKGLSLEGLFNLLDGIEGRLHGEQTCVYRHSTIDGRQLDEMISLCDDGAGLNDEDLEACGALVLRELQRLSWSTEKGCLLPQDVVSAHQSSTKPYEISASLPPNAARLWDRWFKHALVLKEHRVLSTERLVHLFTPLLLQRHATYSQQAKVLLRTLLSCSNEKRPSADDKSDLSSLCSPSAVADRNAEPVGSKQKRQIQELQRTEEDSPDESSVESGPIRESKAYQSLKQSAMQEGRLQQEDDEEEEEEEEEDFPGINQGHEEDLGRAKRSSHQDPYPGFSEHLFTANPFGLW